MGKKLLVTFLLVLLLTASMTGCGSSKDTIAGKWVAAGVIYNDNVYSFAEHDTLADLYDLHFIFVNEDGSYEMYAGALYYEGTWSPFEGEGYEDAFKLQNETCKMGTNEVQKTDSYEIVFLLEDDPNVLAVADDDMVLLYLKEGTTSTVL